MEDPSVLRAKLRVERVRTLVEAGTLPRAQLEKAQADFEDAMDEASITRALRGMDMTAEMAAQTLAAAERRMHRCKRAVAEQQELLDQGIISKAEFQAAQNHLDNVAREYDWALEHQQQVAEIASSAAAELAILKQLDEGSASVGGAMVERFDGKGTFTPADFARVSAAYNARFSHDMPISANGETEVHRSMGFDHSNRIDVALTPDSIQGQWLRQYLTANRIPFFAFRGAVAHQATGAHIHMGPPSTRYVQAKTPSTVSGGGN
jgi:hypothetical protein